MRNTFENVQQPKSPEDEVLAKYDLKAGDPITIKKHKILEGSSSTPVGTITQGTLAQDVVMGEPIRLNEGGNTSELSGVAEVDGRLLVKTATSVYEIILNNSEKSPTITKADLEQQIEANKKLGGGKWDGILGKIPPNERASNLVMTNNGFKVGDKVIFFFERERKGTLKIDNAGDIVIVDERGMPQPILAILLNTTGYIKKE